jgi:hypothetical protein
MMRDKKGVAFVFYIVLFSLFFVLIMSLSSYYIQTSSNFLFNQTNFTDVSENVREDFCVEKFNINYTYDPINPNEPYCTYKYNSSNESFYYLNNISGLNFTSWYTQYVEDNKYIEDDSVNDFVDKFLFGLIMLAIIFSVFTAYQKDVITNAKAVFVGIFGVPISLFIFIVLSRVVSYITELVGEMFPEISTINLFAPFPLLDHFFNYMFWYLIPFTILWVIGLVTNKEIVGVALEGGGDDNDN